LVVCLGRIMTSESPKPRPAENGALLAGIAAFVLAAALVPGFVRPALDQLFSGYTPHHLATLIGVGAGIVAARLGYRHVGAWP
jgi:hypothetical protein